MVRLSSSLTLNGALSWRSACSRTAARAAPAPAACHQWAAAPGDWRASTRLTGTTTGAAGLLPTSACWNMRAPGSEWGLKRIRGNSHSSPCWGFRTRRPENRGWITRAQWKHNRANTSATEPTRTHTAREYFPFRRPSKANYHFLHFQHFHVVFLSLRRVCFLNFSRRTDSPATDSAVQPLIKAGHQCPIVISSGVADAASTYELGSSANPPALPGDLMFSSSRWMIAFMSGGFRFNELWMLLNWGPVAVLPACLPLRSARFTAVSNSWLRTPWITYPFPFTAGKSPWSASQL